MSDPLIVIPARMAATRLPEKPLAEIAGEPMIVQVWRRASEAGVGPVLVACDDRRILAAVEQAGGTAILTRPDHPSGSIASTRRSSASIRMAATMSSSMCKVICPPSIRPASTRRSCRWPILRRYRQIGAVIERGRERDNPNVVKVVGAPIGPAGYAAFISPARQRRMARRSHPPYRLYAYRRPALKRFITLPPSALEQREKARAAPRRRGRHAHRLYDRRCGSAPALIRLPISNAPAPSSPESTDRRHDQNQPHRLPGRTRREFADRLQGRLSRYGKPALRHLRGCAAGRARWRGRPGDDSDREFRSRDVLPTCIISCRPRDCM